MLFRESSKSIGVWALALAILAPVTPIAASINAQAVPNRTSGVAPLSVFFDATATTPTAIAFPYHDCLYTWGFGDPSSGTWSTDGKSKNVAYGPLSAHVFESAGTFTWTLDVKDSTGATAHLQGTITVTAPANDATTYCFSTSGDFTGAPSGCPSQNRITTSSFKTACSYAAPGRRILLHAGEIFTLIGDSEIGALSGPGIIGKYGSGANPIIDCSGSSTAAFEFYRCTDWRLMDLEFDNTNGTSAVPCIFFTGAVNCLALRLEVYGNGRGITSNWGYYSSLDGNGIVDCSIHDVGNRVDDGWGIYFGGKRFAILGNDCERSWRHVIRIMAFHRMVIEHNKAIDPQDPNWGSQALKVHEDIGLDSTPATYAVISDNEFSDIVREWTVAIGPQNDVVNENGTDIIFERNKSYSKARSFMTEWEKVTIRNNIFIEQGFAWDWIGAWVGSSGLSTCNNIWIYNNTGYSARTDPANQFSVIQIGTGTNIIVRNNFGSAPNWVNKLAVRGSPTIQSNNALSNTPGFVNAAAGDLRLQAGSSAIDAGSSVPVFGDLYDWPRPVGTGWDLGATEYSDTGPDIVPPAAPTKLRQVTK